MKIHRLVLGLALIAFCGAAAADDLTWVNAADTNEWYRFSRVPETEDPIVWVNNWGQEYYQYAGMDPPDFMRTPVWADNAHINIDGADLHSESADVSGVEVGLGGTLLLRNTLRCITLNTAGLVTMGRDGEIYQCAVQDNGGTGVLRSVKGATFTIADPLLRDVIISVPVEIPDTMALGLLGDIQLNNTIDILASSQTSRLVIDGNVTLTGSGWVETSTSTDNEVCNHYNNGQRLTNQVTIHAAGRIGCDNIAVTNEALIVADRTGMLTINPDDEPGDGQPPFANTGTLRAAGGATLRLDRGVFDNTGGVIEAQDGSVVEFFDYAHVTGGTLQTTGSGEIRPSGTGSSVADLTVAGGSALVIPDGRKLKAEGTVTIDGQLRLDSTGTGSTLIVRSPVSLVGAGEVVFSDFAGNRFSHDGIDGGYRLTTAIPISGATGSTRGLCNGIAFTNQSIVTANAVTPLLIDPSNTPIDGQAGVINSGTLRAVGGATMRLVDGSFNNVGGVIEAQEASTVELHDAVSLTGGLVRSIGSGVVRSTTGYLPPSLADLTLEGRLEALGSADLRLGGTVVNNGVIEVEDFILPSGDLVLAGRGELRLVDGAQIRPEGDSVTNGADHAIRASGAAQSRIHHPLANDGTLVVDSGATLRIDDTCDAAAGSTIRVDGTLLPIGGLVMEGELAGVGSISGTVDLVGPGVLSPGSSIGTLAISNLNIEDGASYRWQTTIGSGSDLVDVIGTLDMGLATLTVDIDPTAGDAPGRVTLFAYDSLATTPGMSQFVLTRGYEFAGIDTSGDELALTGVTNPTLVFADGFETGTTGNWDVVQGSLLKSLTFEPPVDELNLRMPLPMRLVERSTESTLVEGFGARSELVLLVLSRDGAIRTGVRSADGWIWSEWSTSTGGMLELQWRPGGVWLYDSHGLIDSAVGAADASQLAHVRARSTRDVRVSPRAAQTR